MTIPFLPSFSVAVDENRKSKSTAILLAEIAKEEGL